MTPHDDTDDVGDRFPISPQEAAETLTSIRRYMERSTEFAHYSAASGFFAGTVSMAASIWLFVRYPFAMPAANEFGAVWGAVAGLALGGAIIATLRRARARGDAALDTPTRMVLAALAPAAFVAVVLTAALALRGVPELLPGIWLLCYGTGLVAASFFARREFQVLGIAALAIGGVALAAPAAWGTLFMGLGFGVLHLGYGIVAWRMDRSRPAVPIRLQRAA